MKVLSMKSILLVLLMGFGFAEIAKAEDNRLANKICLKGYNTWPAIDGHERFERSLFRTLKLPEDMPNKEQHVVKFFNENNAKLICGEDTDNYIRKNEHVLKRSLARAEHTYLIHVANSVKYDGFDWNFYEMVDGKKETILDYLDMIFNDPELAEDYDIPELKSLVRVIEQDGGKRGHELE